MLVPSRIRLVSILVESGQDQSGSVETGHVRLALVKTGLVRPRPVWFYVVQSGPVKTGLVL